MNAPDTVVVDYGVGNLLSVTRGFEHCGTSVIVSDAPDVILSARRVVVPGVGAFANAMEALEARKLIPVVHEVVKRGIPLLGICLGMQLLFDESEEFGLTKGLGIIPGRVVPIPNHAQDGSPLKIPHIGWNTLHLPHDTTIWDNTCLANTQPGSSFYFVHSFMAMPNDPAHRLADCHYGGHPISAVVRKGQVTGCQFHPEKSGEAGLEIIRKFCEL